MTYDIKNKNILFIIPSLALGGAEILLIQQVRWCRDNGWKPSVAILSHNNDSNLLNELDQDPEQLLIFNSSHAVLNTRAIVFALKHSSELTSFAKCQRVSNIVAHLPLAHFWGRLVKRKMQVAQLMVYHHSMQYQASPLNSFSKKVFNTLQKLLAAKTDDVSVCISEAVQQNIRENFVLKNPVVIYNAVSDKGSKSLFQGNLTGNNYSSIKLVIPGRLHPSKGHLFFLDVFKQLVKEFPGSLRLIIAGGGTLEGEIESFIARNGLKNIVTITGSVSNDELLKQLAEADLVLIPSLSEGLGIVGIEALMLGKTVVASDTGGLKEVFTDGRNGYIFRAAIYDSCLNVMRSVLSNLPSSILPPAVLREDYERRFSFDVYIKRFVAMLKKSE